MEKKKYTLRVALSLCALLGWWGLLFPELTLTPDTVRVTDNAGAVVETDIPTGNRLYLELLQADPGDITYSFKFIETISSFWEAMKNDS